MFALAALALIYRLDRFTKGPQHTRHLIELTHNWQYFTWVFHTYTYTYTFRSTHWKPLTTSSHTNNIYEPHRPIAIYIYIYDTINGQQSFIYWTMSYWWIDDWGSLLKKNRAIEYTWLACGQNATTTKHIFITTIALTC